MGIMQIFERINIVESQMDVMVHYPTAIKQKQEAFFVSSLFRSILVIHFI